MCGERRALVEQSVIFVTASIEQGTTKGARAGLTVQTGHASVLLSNGKIQENTGGVFSNQTERFSYCEKQIGRALLQLLLSGGTKQLDIVENQAKPSISGPSEPKP